MGTSTIDTGTIVSNILSGTNTSLATFEPIFAILGGLLLAWIVIHLLISAFTGRRVDMFAGDEDEVL